jgi:hypothetical protein
MITEPTQIFKINLNHLIEINLPETELIVGLFLGVYVEFMFVYFIFNLYAIQQNFPGDG